ncbi:hypothetical protein B0H16DRAFT_1750229 [Mycena metata]|uniref:Uncharacterized protein n=1 Tax=Mycena metata TaxID=1033252 RepID=A0AAD7GP26_9AGAR|nr:hypothetical protein B0H16DRAFT_1750229 [Mycena metata]
MKGFELPILLPQRIILPDTEGIGTATFHFNNSPSFRRGNQFITDACAVDSDCQQGCCAFSNGKCAGPAVAQTNGSGGCGHGNSSPNCNVAAPLNLSDCIAGGVNEDLSHPGVQTAIGLVAQLGAQVTQIFKDFTKEARKRKLEFGGQGYKEEPNPPALECN